MCIITKLWMSTLYSMAGLRAVWQRELAFRLEVIVAFILTPLLFVIPELSVTQKAIMLISVISPMIFELMNSAVESLCNLLTKEHHVEIKFVKDAASAAVFLSNIVMILTWGICLWHLV